MKTAKRITIAFGLFLVLQIIWYFACVGFSSSIANLVDLDEVKARIGDSRIISGYYVNRTEESILSSAEMSFDGQPIDAQRGLPHMWVSLQDHAVFPSIEGMGYCGYCILFGAARFSEKPDFGHMGGMHALIDNAVVVWGPIHRLLLRWTSYLFVVSYILYLHSALAQARRRGRSGVI
jgi:hypothetical protein